MGDGIKGGAVFAIIWIILSFWGWVGLLVAIGVLVVAFIGLLVYVDATGPEADPSYPDSGYSTHGRTDSGAIM